MGCQVALVLGDLHAGSSFSVCPPEFPTYEGSTYGANPVQEWIWGKWEDFNAWSETIIGADPFVFIHNGDAIEGLHHGTKQVISASVGTHVKLAIRLLGPIAQRAARTYVVKGTEAHVGIEAEADIGRAIGAAAHPDTGEHAAYHWLLNIHGTLVSFRHHIGATSRKQLEATQLSIHLGEEQLNHARHRQRPPDVICRGHRHVFGQFSDSMAMTVVGPSWQVKTAYGHKVVPSSTPTVGGYILDWRGLPEGHLPRVHARVYAPDPVEAEAV